MVSVLSSVPVVRSASGGATRGIAIERSEEVGADERAAPTDLRRNAAG